MREKRLTKEEVINIFVLKKDNKTHKEIAEKYNISETSISNILTRKHHSDVFLPDFLDPNKDYELKELKKRIEKIEENINNILFEIIKIKSY